MADFSETIGHLTIARERVRSIPIAGLTEAQKKKRQGQLKELRIAVEILVTEQYEELAADAKASADALIAAAKESKLALESLDKAAAIINTVASLLNTVRSFVAVVRPL